MAIANLILYIIQHEGGLIYSSEMRSVGSSAIRIDNYLLFSFVTGIIR